MKKETEMQLKVRDMFAQWEKNLPPRNENEKAWRKEMNKYNNELFVEFF